MFSKLPGIGTKTAERLVFFILRKSKQDRTALISALSLLNGNITLCRECGYITDAEDGACQFCSDPKRSTSIICVVADIPTVQIIEKSGVFKGLYHVLGGTINPIEGTTAQMLNIPNLKKRLSANKGITEVLLATGTDIEGEQTALYLAKELKTAGIAISRLARGIPRGSNLEYTDELTLADAIKERKQV